MRSYSGQCWLDGHRRSTAVLAVAALCMAAVAWGQPPGGPLPLGPIPLGGPFGWPNPFGGVMLLAMPAVQQELQITEAQRPQLEKVLQGYQDRMQQIFETIDFQALGELSEQERVAGFEQVRQQQDRATQQAFTAVDGILDERQRQRFEQLQVQQEGAAALMREDIATRLQLTEEQREQIRRLLEPRRPGGPRGAGRPPGPEAPGGPFGPEGPGGPFPPRGIGGPGPLPDFEALRKEREEAEAQAIALLTKEQRAAWEELRGKPFAFPAPPGPGGPGFMAEERQLLAEFDADGSGWLNADERAKARAKLAEEERSGRGGRRRGPFAFGPPGFGPSGPRGPGNAGTDGPGPNGRPGPRFGQRGFGPLGPTEPAQPGPKVALEEVPRYDAPLYEPTVLRTIFLEFESDDWEAELEDFYNTDVDVPATLVVDGRRYENVGVHFRGMSSYGTVPTGYKRSLNISLDLVDAQQRLDGYKTLNLLNCHGDPSLLSTVLYSHIAQHYLPVPKANFARLVVNGESWGVYVNVQQFDKVFVEEHWGTSEGARWKVRGSPAGGGGLEYLGENIDDYKQRYELKSRNSKQAWRDLVRLCRTLNETPLEDLEAALEPLIDLDGLLWFLALDVALINNDGYWIRASDYSLYQDPSGKFHIVPHDMNEAFQPALGFGFPGPRRPGSGANPAAPPPRAGGTGPGGQASSPDAAGPAGAPAPDGSTQPELPPGPARGGPDGPLPGRQRGAGLELDPLVGLDDPRKPLRSRVLAVPALRKRYLQCVRTIAHEWLDWQRIGPVAEAYHELIDPEVQRDTRKLTPYEAFQQALTAGTPGDVRVPRRASLPEFCRVRRAYLLQHPAIQEAAETEPAAPKEDETR